MARKRKFTPTAQIRGQIRALVNQGLTNSEINDVIRNKYPNVNANTLRTLTANERRQQNAINSIYNGPANAVSNIASTINCPPGSTRVRTRATVTYTDPETGEARSFSYTVDLPLGATNSDILSAALDQVRREAARRGSPFPGANGGGGDENFQVTLGSLTCI